MNTPEAPFSITHGTPETAAHAPRDHKPAIPERFRDVVLPEGAHWNRDGSITLVLIEPVVQRFGDGESVETRETAELTFHRLKGADMMDVSEASRGREQLLRMLCASLRKSGPVVEAMIAELDAADFGAASDIVGVFTGSGRKKTGR